MTSREMVQDSATRNQRKKRIHALYSRNEKASSFIANAEYLKYRAAGSGQGLERIGERPHRSRKVLAGASGIAGSFRDGFC